MIAQVRFINLRTMSGSDYAVTIPPRQARKIRVGDLIELEASADTPVAGRRYCVVQEIGLDLYGETQDPTRFRFVRKLRRSAGMPEPAIADDTASLLVEQSDGSIVRFDIESGVNA